MIVKMSRLSIVGLMEERSAIVRRLMKLGAVQLAEIPMSAQEKEQALSMAAFDDASKRIADIDEELRKIKTAIDFLSENAPAGEKTLHSEVTYESFVDPNAYKGVWEKIFDANDLQKRLLSKKSELSAAKNERALLDVWKGLSTPVELKGTKTVSVAVGTLPASADVDSLLKTVDEIGLTVADVINTDKDQSYLSFTIHNSVLDRVEDELKSYGFSKAGFGVMSGTIAHNISRVDDEIQRLDGEIQKIIDETAQRHGDLADIQRLYDYIFNMQERRRVRGNFLKTDKAFIVGGWTPADSADGIKKDIESRFTACVDVIPVEKDEETPVLLKNNAIVYPFEMITEMYSLPSSGGIDPNAAMTPFYWMFFGLMLSDAGYGILLSLLCGIAIYKLKPERGTLIDKMLKMLFLCGFSTVIWGAAFGSWFGDVPALVFGRGIAPLWFNPNNDPMRLMVWSFIFGIIHLFTGMALNAYMLIRDGKWLDAIFDVGLWYAVLIGVVLLFLGGQPAAFGKNMAVIGAIGLVLTQGRHEKNIIKKFTSGVLSLYNVTGYLSDVLSYSRLLALGLATGVIAQVINQLGLMSGFAIAVVLIVGHIFNMMINILGAYVHSSRLQYVEFFGKFYESGGSAFAPLKTKMKYLKIRKPDMI